MLYGLCQSYHALPGPGGVLDQSTSVLRMQSVLSEGGYFGTPEPKPIPHDPLADIPMMVL